AGLGHAPGMDQISIKDPIVLFGHGAERSVSAHHYPLKFYLVEIERVTTALDIVEQDKTDDGHTQREIAPLIPQEPINTFTIQAGSGQYQLCSTHGGGVRDTPRVDVEQGHHQQYRITCIQAKSVGSTRHPGMQDHRTVAVEDALGI